MSLRSSTIATDPGPDYHPSRRLGWRPTRSRTRCAGWGSSAERVQLVALLPLVRVAWADARVQRAERDFILEVGGAPRAPRRRIAADRRGVARRAPEAAGSGDRDPGAARAGGAGRAPVRPPGAGPGGDLLGHWRRQPAGCSGRGCSRSRLRTAGPRGDRQGPRSPRISTLPRLNQGAGGSQVQVVSSTRCTVVSSVRSGVSVAR